MVHLDWEGRRQQLPSQAGLMLTIGATKRRKHSNQHRHFIYRLEYHLRLRVRIRVVASHSASSPQPRDNVVTLPLVSVFSHTLPLLFGLGLGFG